MSTAPAALWPWLAVAGLGVFHGANPAMGWLFAVALGLHRHSRRIVLLSLLPIALGHAAAVLAVVAGVLMMGIVLGAGWLTRFAGLVLVAWAIWHAWRGHRQKPRIGMQTGLMGLALWSLIMASSHGAGLMLIPVMGPLCAAAAPANALGASQSISLAAAAVGVHTLAMLATIAGISLAVYDWLGLGLLRTAWINLDRIWIAALACCGFVLALA